MVRPIVVMYIPEIRTWMERGQEMTADSAADILTRVLNGNFDQPTEEAGIVYPDYWKDYYWLVFPKRDIDEPQLQVFYEKDFTPIKFEELRKFIEETLKAEKAVG